MKRVGTDGRSAARVPTHGPQVVQPFQASALALPVTNGIINKSEFAQTPKIGDWENGLKNALQTGIVALIGHQIHLQEAFVRLLLHLDQIRNGYRGLDLRKIYS